MHFALLLFVCLASSQTYPIVGTNQTRCFDSITYITCPYEGEDFFGQNGNYEFLNDPDYLDNGDGTVTDLITGLMWPKGTLSEKLTYADALADASSYNLAGYNDWRLPTIKELYSLMLFSGMDPGMDSDTDLPPFISTTYFDFEYGDVDAGERIIDVQYASSTLYVGTVMGNSECMFGLNLADGRIKCYGIDKKTFVIKYVRNTRNTEYGINDFHDNKDGTITDNATDLMWEKSDSGEGMNWKLALEYVKSKNAEKYLGYSDWRLPTAKELQSIVDYTKSPQINNEPAIYDIFEITQILNEADENDYPFFWTSTTHEGSVTIGRNAAYVCFGQCLGYFSPDSSIKEEWMDVHGAGAQRSDPKHGEAGYFGPQGDAQRIDNFIRLVRLLDSNELKIREGVYSSAITIGGNMIVLLVILSLLLM